MVQTRTRKYRVAKKVVDKPGKPKRVSKWTTNPSASVRVTRALAIAGPRQAIFDTAEILEQILSYLSASTLWACQRVSKQFRAITQTSPLLQMEMMLRPRPGPRPCWRLEHSDWINDPFARSKFLVHDGSPVAPSDGRLMFGQPAMVRKSLWTPARLCPLLSVNSGWHEAAKQDSAFRLCGQKGEHVRFNCSKTIMSTPGAWENVLVTDPPCLKADVTLQFVVGHYGIPDGTLHLSRTVENPVGLTCSDLLFGALKMPGLVNWSLNGRRYSRQYKRPDKVLKRLEERLGVKAILDLEHWQTASWTRVYLHRMAIPAEKEWSTVK